MIETMRIIEEGIQELFPEADEMELSSETQLEELPDWDSMSSVNLQSYLEQAFSISVPQDFLDEEKTIGELAAFIKAGGK